MESIERLDDGIRADGFHGPGHADFPCPVFGPETSKSFAIVAQNGIVEASDQILNAVLQNQFIQFCHDFAGEACCDLA